MSTAVTSGTAHPSRHLRRAPGAYRLLIALLDASVYPTIEVDPRGACKGSVLIPSVRKLARLLGTQSSRINEWLAFLETQGYVTSLTYSEDRRSCRVRLRRPRNV